MFFICQTNWRFDCMNYSYLFLKIHLARNLSFVTFFMALEGDVRVFQVLQLFFLSPEEFWNFNILESQIVFKVAESISLRNLLVCFIYQRRWIYFFLFCLNENRLQIYAEIQNINSNYWSGRISSRLFLKQPTTSLETQNYQNLNEISCFSLVKALACESND